MLGISGQLPIDSTIILCNIINSKIWEKNMTERKTITVSETETAVYMQFGETKG
jgi:hypothetical protein